MTTKRKREPLDVTNAITNASFIAVAENLSFASRPFKLKGMNTQALSTDLSLSHISPIRFHHSTLDPRHPSHPDSPLREESDDQPDPEPIVVPDDVDPLMNLTRAQRDSYDRLMWAMRSFEISPDIEAYATPQVLLGHLRGYLWDETKALDSLRTSLEWRNATRPDEVSIDNLCSFVRRHSLDRYPLGFHFGFDRPNPQEGRPHRRPLIWLFIGNATRIPDTQEGRDFLFSYICLVSEHALHTAELAGLPRSYCAVMDLSASGWSLVRAIVRNGRQFAKMTDYYCDCLGSSAVVNAGLLLRVIWRAVGPFMEEDTRKKFLFLKGPDDLVTQGVCDWDQIPRGVGLDCPGTGILFDSESSSRRYSLLSHLEFLREEQRRWIEIRNQRIDDCQDIPRSLSNSPAADCEEGDAPPPRRRRTSIPDVNSSGCILDETEIRLRSLLRSSAEEVNARVTDLPARSRQRVRRRTRTSLCGGKSSRRNRSVL